jgi:L-aspartate oxidase
MARYHAAGDLAPRDVVARSITLEMERTGGAVSLTLAHMDAERVRSRFPTIAAMCREVGLDLATDLIPVGPAAHYLMGGIETDVWGRTSMAGLFAAGETACTGVHGANRLASNSLLEGLVFGARAAEAMQQPLRAGQKKGDRIEVASQPLAPSPDPPTASLGLAAIRDLMWRAAGLFRTHDALASAVAILDREYLVKTAAVARAPRPDADAWRAFNLFTVARLIAQAALRREESRGGHFRADFPRKDDLHWKVHLVDVRSS